MFRTAVLPGQPCGSIFFPPMLLHIADYGPFAVHIAVPCTEGFVNIVLGERAQKLMELWIGFGNHLLMQAVAELRHIRILFEKLHITGAKNRAAHSGVALNHSVFMVSMAAGVAVCRILHDGGGHNRLVLFQHIFQRGLGRFCFGFMDRSRLAL